MYVILLYGSTLVFGCSNGSLFFYNVKIWNQFDLLNAYDCAKQCLLPADFGPIRCVDVIERSGERIFYISGNTTVYKVIGQTK